MRRRPCDLAVHSPCERALFRRVPVLFRRGAPRGGSSGAPADPYLYGLSNFSAGSFMANPSAGGEAGTAVGGFGNVLVFRLKSLSTTAQTLRSRLLTSGANGGWQQILSAANVVTAYYHNTAGLIAGGSYTLTASDMGKVLVLVSRITALPGNIKTTVSKTSAPNVAITNYTAGTATPSTLGAYLTGTQPCTNIEALAELDFRGDPSDTQISDLLDAIRVLGDAPTTMGGATVTHRWSLKDELAGATVVNGQQAPAQLTDRVTQAAGDALVRQGIDVKTGPNGIRGVGPYGVADGWKSAAGGGIQGANAGWHVAFDLVFSRVPVTTGTIANADISGTGWFFAAYSTGVIAATLRTNAGPSAVTPNYTVVGGDVGARTRCLLQYTGTVVRFYVNNVQVGADAALASFTPLNTAPFYLGGLVGTNAFADGYVEAAEGGNTVLTAGEIATLFADRTQALPTIAGKTQKRYIFEQDIAAANGAMPTTSVERISGNDSLSLVGGPVRVVKIDPAIDGRRLLGAQGFSQSSFLQAATGINGSAGGMWIGVHARFTATGGMVVNRYLTSGWYIQQQAAQVRFVIFNAGGTFTATSYYTVPTGVPCSVLAQYTGTAIQLWIDGVQQGADVASVTLGIPSTPMLVGSYTGQQFDGGFFGLAGANRGDLTLAEIVAWTASNASAGRIQSITGKTDHLYDLTTDILASGVDAVPAVVLDRVGTDNLTRVGPDYQVGGKRGLALTTAVNQLQTAPGGGILGAASALTVSLLFSPIVQTVGAAIDIVASKQPLGWDFRRSLGVIQAGVTTSTTGVATSNYSFVPGDVGTLKLASITYDGANARFYMDGVLMGATALTGAMGTATAAMLIGAYGPGGLPTTNDTAFFGIAGGAYVATAAELLAQATASKAAGQLVAIPGKTDDRIYNFDQDAAAQGTALPSQCINRAANGVVDPLVRIGSPLTLAQQTARLFSYETTPTRYEVNAFTDTDFYQGTGGPGESAAGCWGCAPLVVDFQTGVTGSRILVCKSNSANGYYLRFTANTTLNVVASDASGAMQVGGAALILPADVGKELLLFWCWDGTKLRTYFKRAEVGSGVTMTGYRPSASGTGLQLGRYLSTGLSATGSGLLGLMGGVGIITLAEVYAAHDAWLAKEDLVAIPGKTDFLQSMKQDAIANGGVLPPTLVDRIGAATLAKNGNPTLTPRYQRAAGW